MGRLGWNSGYIGSDQRDTAAGAVGYSKYYLERLDGRFNPVLDRDPDAQAFFDRVTAAGGSLTLTEQIAVNTLVIQMKADGIWTKMKAIYPMVGASAAACAQNLKSSSFTGTFSSGWTFASTGVTPNGTSAFMDTNFNANTLSSNSSHLSFYSRTNSGTNGSTGKIDIGCQVAGSQAIFIGISTYNQFEATFYSTTANIKSSSPTDTRGYVIATVQSLSSFKAFWKQTGLSFSQKGSTINNVLGSLPNNNIYISANGTNLTKYEYSNRECAFASIGDGLTDTEASNLDISVQAFQTTLSRNV